VIDVVMFRTIVEVAYILTLVCNDDPVNDVMPPHCRLIGQLHEYAGTNPTKLRVGEIVLVVQYDGLLTANPLDGGDLLIAVTYTMPVARATAQAFDKARRVEVVRMDTGGLVQRKGSELSLGVLGNFLRHVGPGRKPFRRRDVGVSRMCEEYNDSVPTSGRAKCEEAVLNSPFARGFLQEGAAQIARETQIKWRSTHSVSRPAEGEYINNWRSIAEILEDPWFAEEAGRLRSPRFSGK
jgi:hypothetical protein